MKVSQQSKTERLSSILKDLGRTAVLSNYCPVAKESLRTPQYNSNEGTPFSVALLSNCQHTVLKAVRLLFSCQSLSELALILLTYCFSPFVVKPAQSQFGSLTF